MDRKLALPGARGHPFRLSTRVRNGTAQITVSGEIDIATAPTLEELLIGTMAGSGSATEVDLANVSFMDASGLTALIRADNKARDVGGRLQLSHVPERVSRLLKISHLDRRFSVLT
ncbi:STAS domain-containing protein [Nonomuraea sp. NPDC049400]|uniref:STAS domain-containing protein n=1 Tax=Nonomuraea sp. NPDC049400 TaxID=3364352 RepID=UPI0037AD7B9A